MSVTSNKADGRTVVTVTSDPKGAWPPLCQILKALCFNPLCCSVSQHLRRVQGTSQSALGSVLAFLFLLDLELQRSAAQIMVGALNVCLGVIIGNNTETSWQFVEDWYPVLLGLLFAAIGTLTVLSERYPSPCLVTASVIANLAGVAFAIAAAVHYNFTIYFGLSHLCYHFEWDYWYGQRITVPPVPSVEESIMMNRCLRAKAKVLNLLQSISTVLLIMSVLELCLLISSAVFGIKALARAQTETNKGTDDPNLYKLPLLKEISTITA